MKFAKLFLTLSLIVAAFAVAMPTTTTSAAETATITITQDQINSSYWVTNPSRRSVTSTVVTLNDGSATVTQQISPRSQQPRETVSVWTPRISANGRTIIWVLQSATITAQAASQAYVNEVSSSWRRIADNLIRSAIRQVRKGSYTITAVSVSPAGIVITITY
jgi:hypothetical protein